MEMSRYFNQNGIKHGSTPDVWNLELFEKKYLKVQFRNKLLTLYALDSRYGHLEKDSFPFKNISIYD